MSIVSSEYVLQAVQANGGRFVIERFTDSVGAVHEMEYFSGVGADYSGILASHATALEHQLALREFGQAVSA